MFNKIEKPKYLKIIPDSNKTINVFKNEGEYK
jgi:hypothetical protein